MSRLSVSTIAALLVATFVPGSAGSAALPLPEQLPATVVAVVTHVPVSLGRVTKPEFQRALAQQAASAGRRSAPKPGNGYERMKKDALGERLNSIWIQGQAAAMGIRVTDREIARELARIKQENFGSEAEYQRFLKDARYTQGDVNERVLLQLLATRIQERVQRQSGVRGFREFVEAFTKRWRARTVCAPEYVAPPCANGPEPE